MDKQKFDALTRAFAMGSSRRTAIKGLFGGAVGVAVATTRFNPTGAQVACTSADDCTLPNACTDATCDDGFCSYVGGCDEGACLECDNSIGQCVNTCGPCQECDGGQCVDTCGPCESCNGGVCVYLCNDCQECEGGFCADLDEGGMCCNGTWVDGAQCCIDDDCIIFAADFCSSVQCENYTCTNVPRCPDGQHCCGQGEEGAHCAQCCSDDDCLGCAVCNEVGQCSDPECCGDTDCPDCEVCGTDGVCYPLMCALGYTCCGGHECVPDDECCMDFGDYCGVEVAGAGGDSSQQYDCCDGLVCCQNWNSQGSVCAQCCNDWDCGKDGYCHEGVCKYPTVCHHDHDCPEHTCCCDDGSCSWHCCDHHHHPHPHPKPPAPPAPEAPVTTLPATGSGQKSDSSNLFGTAALGAAAALYAAKKLRETPEAPETTE